MREPAPPTVNLAPATCYTVRNDWAWAHIFVRHGSKRFHPSRDERHWVDLSVLSDFGEFGYCWSHIGGDWRPFLAGLDFDYAMKKMLGSRYRTPLSIADAANLARRQVIDLRKVQQACTADEARRMFDAIADAALQAHDCRDFIREWDKHSSGLMYRFGLYDASWDEPCPQAQGFWREIWPHFVTQLQTEAAALSTETAA